jgi:hypothetical protein
LCGLRGYAEFADWAQQLGSKARERFGCRWAKGRFEVPSRFVLRDVLLRTDPAALDQALQCWNHQWGALDSSLALDGKTMRAAIDGNGRQIQVMSVVGHQSGTCLTEKKLAPCPGPMAKAINRPTKSAPSSRCSMPSTT